MIKRIIFENFWWKVLSLALSVGLWLSLVGEAERDASTPAEIQFKNFPPDLAISSDPVDRLFVRVRGPANRLSLQALAQAAVVVDLAKVNGPGEQTFTFSEKDVVLPIGVSLERVIPAQVRLRFERRITRDVPVKVRFAGSPPKGYSVTDYVCTPSRIRITGPESHVEHMTNAETDALDISSTVADNTFHASTFIGDPHVQIVGSPVVSVHVKLQKTSAGQE